MSAIFQSMGYAFFTREGVYNPKTQRVTVMDEAAAKLRMERDSLPEELDELTRRLKQLEIEREYIAIAEQHGFAPL